MMANIHIKKINGIYLLAAICSVALMRAGQAYAGDPIQIGDPGASTCGSNGGFESFMSSQHGCFKSGLGWVYYKFSDEFNALSVADKKKVMDHLYLGPGSDKNGASKVAGAGAGNGGWQPVKALSNCFTETYSAVGFYRFGMIQYKTSASFTTTDNFDGWQSYSDLLSSSTPGAMLTGNQNRKKGNTTDRKAGEANLSGKSLSQVIKIKSSGFNGGNVFTVATAMSFTNASNDGGDDPMHAAADTIAGKYHETMINLGKDNDATLLNNWKSSGSNGVMSFCGFSGTGEEDATYNGSVSISVGGTTAASNSDPNAPVDDESSAIEYGATEVSRDLAITYKTAEETSTGIAPSYSVSFTVSEKDIDGGSWSAMDGRDYSSAGTATGTTIEMTSNNNALALDTQPGKIYKICATNTYQSQAHKGTGVANAVYSDGKAVTACAYIKRPLIISKLSSTTTGFAKYVDDMSHLEDHTTAPNSNESYKINVQSGRGVYAGFSHELTRTNPQFETPNFTVTQWRDGVSSSLTTLFGLNASTLSYSSADSAPVVLRPQEEKTFSAKIEHPEEINNKPEVKGDASSGLSLTLHGKDYECDESFDSYKKFGIKTGYNMGIVRVHKNNGAWKSSTNFSNDEASDEVSVWAKPSDTIQFNHLACAGGTYTARFKDGGANDSVIDRTSFISSARSTLHPTDNYLWGDKFTLAYQEDLKGIDNFLTNNDDGNSYSVSVMSPSTSENSYQIDGNQVGSVISHNIEWADIAYKDGDILSGRDGSNKKNATASAKIPYNYILTPVPQIQGGSTTSYVVPGANVSVGGTLGVNARRNDAVGDTYATKTRKTTTKVIAYLSTSSSFADSSTLLPSSFDESASASSICHAIDGACAYEQEYTSGSKEYTEDTNSVNMASLADGVYPVRLDGVKVGTKVCVIAAAYPADSHGNASVESPTDQEPALQSANPSGSQWIVSAPACRTIAKKPTASFEGGNVLVKGDARASRTVRNTASGTDFFGSWSEYGALIGGNNFGLVSGAATGYRNANHVGVNQAVFDSGMSALSSTGELCMYNTQTIANEACDDEPRETGLMDVDNLIIHESSYVAHLISRYAPKAGADASTYSSGAIDGCYLDDGKFVHNGDSAEYYCYSDGAAVAYFDGSKTISGINNLTMTDAVNKTFVIYVKGTATIESDITLNNNGHTGVSDVPNVIIIADNIDITSNVSRIDAWLITGGGSATGLINTCSSVTEESLNAAACNNQLIINGFVYAKAINFRRTAGAGTPIGGEWFDSRYYIQRAEIINLPSYAYLWGYGSAMSNSTMTTTYIRELPVRY